MEVKEKLRKYLGRFYRKHVIEDDENIFELGFVNSLFSMQLVMFIEKEFGVTINNEDLDLEKFKSINSIAELVESKLN